MTWFWLAALSALAAGATDVLSEIGLDGVPSNLATAIRSTVIVAFAWAAVPARGEARALPMVPGRGRVGRRRPAVRPTATCATLSS